jgi:predicted transcriptional regulator
VFILASYRSKVDIIADILSVAIQKPKKTQIMYQAHLNFALLQRYLTELLEASLLDFQDTSQCYVLTAKGQEFLTAYREYSKVNRRFEKVISEVNAKKAHLEKLFSQ